MLGGYRGDVPKSLSMNEIRTRAAQFIRDWENEPGDERQQAQSYVRDLLGVYGITQTRAAFYEKRVNRDDLPFFLGLMDHLALKGLSCPLPIERRDGGHLGELAGRPAAMVSFLDGAWLRKPQAPHCQR